MPMDRDEGFTLEMFESGTMGERDKLTLVDQS